jgi:hypothetical protein
MRYQLAPLACRPIFKLMLAGALLGVLRVAASL